jgi:hypothetical protein
VSLIDHATPQLRRLKAELENIGAVVDRRHMERCRSLFSKSFTPDTVSRERRTRPEVRRNVKLKVLPILLDRRGLKLRITSDRREGDGVLLCDFATP